MSSRSRQCRYGTGNDRTGENALLQVTALDRRRGDSLRSICDQIRRSSASLLAARTRIPGGDMLFSGRCERNFAQGSTRKFLNL
ncbi:hypothetical protein KSP40_PGU014979 [Platanthera guangdongensis]|uniref:Uncharacterized protein n=1 Tax=Platanthera guangdongensis TaxID=2320717 RepID=A0ABR2LVG0_9ASPA